jgi:acyl-CoA reductase-like NAD-dependent aldehyde dehydrogenase
MSKLMENNKKNYAQIMTDEMGKTFKEGIWEIDKCIE